MEDFREILRVGLVGVEGREERVGVDFEELLLERGDDLGSDDLGDHSDDVSGD